MANPNATPGVGTTITATPRKILLTPDGASYLPRGAVISGANARDPGNVGDIDVLRAGIVMGKRSNDDKYAPSILGRLTAAGTPAGATITMDALGGDELVRRVVAGGLFKVVGAPGQGISEVQTVTIDALATGGTYKIQYGGEITDDIAFNATTAAVQTALDLLPNVTAGDITVQAVHEIDTETTCTFTFLASLGDVDMITYDISDTTTTATVTSAQTTLGEALDIVKVSNAMSFSAEAAGVVTLAANGAVSEVQTSTLDALMTAGTFTMTYKGFTTAAIAFDATVAQITAALELLPSVTPGMITMQAAHEPDTELACTWTFLDTLGNVPMLSLDFSLATGPTECPFVETTPGELVGAATLGINAAIGSLVIPADGSETPLALVVDEYGVKVTDDDNVTNLDVEFPRALIGGKVVASQIVGYPTEEYTRAWLKTQMRLSSTGWMFDDDF